MNNKKIIIRNCPAFDDMPNLYGEVYGYCDNEHDIDLNKCMCENITDCLLKQIVELCKDAQSECSCKNPIKDIDCFECTSGGRAELGIKILKLLDIEEVE